MHVVAYEHALEYPYDRYGLRFPRLAMRLVSPNGAEAADIDAYLDTGAERSLFSGHLAPVVGLELLAGKPVDFQSVTGAHLQARLHPVRLEHPALGLFSIDVAFSVSGLSRNLLGRDFLAQIQVGFREAHQVFFVTAQP